MINRKTQLANIVFSYQSYILESMRERLIIILLIFTMSLKTAPKAIQENEPNVNLLSHLKLVQLPRKMYLQMRLPFIF